jgi:hypothetical protein
MKNESTTPALIVTVVVLMVMVVIAGVRTGWLDLVVLEIGDCLDRIRFPGHHHPHPTRIEILHKTRAGAAGDQNIHHLIQVETTDLGRFPAGVHFIDEEAAGLAGVGGNGPEILTGDCNLHGNGFLKFDLEMYDNLPR